MFTRSILLPSLIVCVIAAPFLYSNAKRASNQNGANVPVSDDFSGAYLPNGGIAGTDSVDTIRQSGSSANFQNAPIGNPAFQANGRLGDMALNPALPINQSNKTAFGNADGPDVSAPPMEFIPVMNFEEIFRFNVDPSWIKGRWNRVSTSPASNGLHGFRVALVTGTNPWDLHGSLTYFFDQNQRAERITFQGWTGDPSVLVNLLKQKFYFKSQPTHLAGFYLAKSWGEPVGGLLMQDPTVIYSEIRDQQIALVLEINTTRGKFSLSEEFRSLIAGSQDGR